MIVFGLWLVWIVVELCVDLFYLCYCGDLCFVVLCYDVLWYFGFDVSW